MQYFFYVSARNIVVTFYCIPEHSWLLNEPHNGVQPNTNFLEEDIEDENGAAIDRC